MTDEIKLLATDFDGTLMTLGVEQSSESRHSFQARVSDIQSQGGVWVLCTGREYSSFRVAYPFLECSGIAPDFIVARGGRIYERLRNGYRMRRSLSLRVIFGRIHATHQARRHMKGAIDVLRAGVEQVQQGEVSLRRIKLWLADEEAAKSVAERLRCLPCSSASILSVCVDHSRIDVRPIGQSKGLALSEIQRVLRIKPDETLSVGDGANDISMLQMSVARWAGCPRNSGRDVIETVVNRGGHVAGEKGISGTVEVINACLRNRIGNFSMATAVVQTKVSPLRMDRFQRDCRNAKCREIILGLGSVFAILYVVLMQLMS